VCNQAEAGDDMQALRVPPSQYPLVRVEISIRYQPGRGLQGGYEITIQGDGRGYYRANAITTELQISDGTIVELLNDFYRIHFFDLADNYQIKKRVVLRDDNLVATTAMKITDISSKRLCIQLADYQKCVTIVNDQPADPAQLINKIERLFNH